MEVDVLSGIVDKQKIVRDRTLEQISNFLQNNPSDASDVLSKIETLVSEHSFWEAQYGCLDAFCIMLKTLDSDSLNDERIRFWKEIIVKNLDNDESRVRKAAASSAGSLVKCCGKECYLFFRDLAVEQLKVYMVRQADVSDGSINVSDDRMDVSPSNIEPDQNDSAVVTNGTHELTNGHVKNSIANGASSLESEEKDAVEGSSEMVLHDTAGWRALESYMACLEHVMDAMAQSMDTSGSDVHQTKSLNVDQELFNLIASATEHRNRFVREMSHHVLSSLICMHNLNSDEESARMFAGEVSQLIARGLSDNWSQVRMSASVVTRKLCELLTRANLNPLLPVLLPPMCLNRYYIAEGVRLYSQQTWRQVFTDTGRQIVCEYIGDVVAFYVQQSEAENHAVREAVCACVTELVTKIDKVVLGGHVETLLELLMVCFDDDSWPVRDSACVATGHFVEAFPEECKATSDEILDNFYHNLTDNIPSVREGAAAALKKFCAVYDDRVSSVFDEMKSGLAAVKEQPENSTVNENLDKGPATYSVAKQIHDNDPSLHENQVMYSCGSLAPKMKKGSHTRRQKNGEKRPDTGGCMAHSFKRPGQPWEITDGFVLLLGELSSVEKLRPKIDQSITILFSKVLQHKHFTHHPKLFTTCYKVSATLFTNMGKIYTKRCLEVFLDGLFYGLTIDNKLAQVAAEDCFLTVAKIIGQNILKGRVENYDSKMLSKLHFVQ